MRVIKKNVNLKKVKLENVKLIYLGGKVMKRNVLVLFLIVATTLLFSSMAFAATYDDVDFTLRATGAGTAKWVQDDSIDAEISGLGAGNETWSIELENTAAASYSAFDFVPTGTITLADFQTDITDATPEYSFRYLSEFAGNGAQFELTFEEFGGTGWLEVTAVGLQSGAAITGSWQTESLVKTTPFGFGGNTPDGSSVFEWSSLTSLDSILTTVNASFDTAEAGKSASAYVLTLVQVELYENEAKVYYIDNIVINGDTYDVDDPVINITESPEETYATIQAAINDATAGDTILVPAGTYNQSSSLTISAEVSLLGPNEGIDPNTGTRVTEATIVGDIDHHVIAVHADNVLIDGFTIQNVFDETQNGDGVLINYGTTGATVQNNIVTLDATHGVWGVMLAYDDATATAIVEDATVSNNKFTGFWGGVYVQGCALNTVISDNVITDVKEGINLGGGNAEDKTKGTSITGNTITGSAMYGISIEESQQDTDDEYDDLLIENNTITGSTLNGIHIYENCGTITGLVIKYNNISGNTNYGIENLNEVGYNAKYNWWGDVTGPEHTTSNPAGEGDIVSDNVTYVPWLDAAYPGGGATGGIPTALTIKASATSVLVGAVVTIEDTLKDIKGNPVYNKRINYSLDGVGTISSDFDTTSGYGYTTVDYLVGNEPGTGIITATLSSDPSISATTTITVGVGPVATVVVTPVKDTLVVLENVTILAKLFDAYLNHIVADTGDVDFATDGNGALGEKSVNDDDNIEIVFTADDSTKTGLAAHETITATYSATIEDEAWIYTVGDIVDEDSLTVTFDDDVITVSDDSSASGSTTFNVVAKDQYGNLTENRRITFVASYGTLESVDTTNGSGVFDSALEYYGGTEAQVVYLTATATEGGATAKDTLYLEAAAVIDSISITGENSVVAGETKTLTFTYFDEFENEADISDDTTFSNISAFGTLAAATEKDTIETDTLILNRAAVYGVLLKKDYTGSDTITVAAVDTIVATAKAGAVVDTFFMNVVSSGALASFDQIEADSYIDTSNKVGDWATFTFDAEDDAGNRRFGYEDSVIVTLNNSAALDTQVIWKDVGIGGLVAAGDDTGFVVNAYFKTGKLQLQLYDEVAEGGLTITVKDTVNSVEVTSAAFGFKPEAVDSLPITITDINNIFAGKEFEFTVTPVDEFGNENKTEKVEFYMSANWPDDFNLSGVPRTIWGSKTYMIISSIAREGQYLKTSGASGDIKDGYSPVFNVRSPDAVDPVVTITAPADGAKLNSLIVAVTGTVVDSSSVTLTVNGVAVDVDSTFSTTVTFAGEGDTVIYAEATDLFDNVGHKTVSITIDTTKPVFANWTPADGDVVYVAKPAISVNITDALAGVDTASIIMKVGVDTVKATLTAITDGYTVAYTPAADLLGGLNTVTIEAADLAGNADYDTISFTVSVVQTEEIALAAGYNLVSVPVDPVVATTIGSIFPDAIAIYGYDDADYVVYSDTTLVPGMAFWVAYLTADTVDVVGYDVDEYTLDVVTGFNLVGALAATANFTDFEDLDGVLVSGWLYGYNAATKAYEAATTLEPGKGYWVAATDTGTIELGAALLAKANVASVPMPEWVGRITVNDNIYSFGKAEAAVNAFDSYDVLMPPVAPGSEKNSSYFENSSSPMFNRYMSDVRSEVGNWVFYIEKGQKAIFDVSNIPAEFDVVTNIDGKQIDLRKDNTIAASKAISIEVGVDLILPEKFVLYRNYPNPFNPTTNIRFDMPTAGHVSLEVYNVLGERVRSLVNTNLNAGRYQYQWDSTNDAGMNVTSGIYFYRIQAADHQKVMKMILMK